MRGTSFISRTRLLLSVAVLLVPLAWGQAPGRGGAIRSPEVSADGRVTLRVRASNAKEVFVTGLGQRLAMQKNEQ